MQERPRSQAGAVPLQRARLTALVVIGGEDTLGVASRLFEEEGLPVVGVPKTIDNDLSATDYTFGFDTAVWIATEAIDRLRDGRVPQPGHGGGGHGPQHRLDRGDERDRRRRGRHPHPRAADHRRGGVRRAGGVTTAGRTSRSWSSSEGYELTYASGGRAVRSRASASDEFGHARLGGVGDVLAREIDERTGFRDPRHRARPRPARRRLPTPRDRVLATRYGLKAADLVHEENFGQMAALRGDAVVSVPLAEAVAELKEGAARVVRSRQGVSASSRLGGDGFQPGEAAAPSPDAAGGRILHSRTLAVRLVPRARSLGSLAGRRAPAAS